MIKFIIKYIFLVIVIVNFMDFFIVFILSVNENKDFIFDRNRIDIENCIGYSFKIVNNIMFIIEVFKVLIVF